MVPAEQIARRADTGDAAAQRVLALYEDRLARSLATIINVLDPDVIVLGCAGLSAHRARLEEAINRPVVDPTQAAVATHTAPIRPPR